MGLEPLDDGFLEGAEGADDIGGEGGGREVLDVFDAGWDGGVGGEGEDQRVDGVGRSGKQGLDEGEVFGGDEDGDGEATCRKVAGEVEEWDEVPLGRVGKYKDVCAWYGR